jgi:hypothetical protein
MKAALRKGNALSSERQFRFVTAFYPVLFRLEEGYPFRLAHEALASFCRSESIPFIDLFEAFSGLNEQDLWVHSTDQHPNETAHHLAAVSLADSLQTMGLMSAKPPSQERIGSKSETGTAGPGRLSGLLRRKPLSNDTVTDEVA